MTTVELPIRPITTNVGAIWKAAIERYEKITMVKIDSLGKTNSVKEILEEIHARETKFKAHRHNGSKLDEFRSRVSKSLGLIETLSNIASAAVSTPFPPSTAIFTAVSYLIKAVNSVSADYDTITGLFDDLDLYLNRLKILERGAPTAVPELDVALTEVLVSVLVLCGICAKYIKMKRIVKAFRNLLSGEDDELSSAFAHFHKMVEQEQGAVRNATLAAVGQLQQESTSIHAAVKEGLAISERTDLNAKTLIASTERMHEYLQSREVDVERNEILTTLSSLDFHKKQKDVFAKHHRGTGQWLLNTNEFQQWFNGEEPSVLWCPGIPGAGKTVMTSLAVDHVQETLRGTKAAIVYIYCDYQDPKTQSELELLSSIARQLTEQIVPMPPAVRQFCDKNAERRRYPTGDEWISLIESLCLLFQKTYVFIDALDECPEANREEFLLLVKKMDFVRLFITSRPHLDLQSKLANRYRIEISAGESDIKTYLEHKIRTNNRLSLFVAKDIKLREDIVNTLIEKSEGMFLLAYLQIDQLCRLLNPKAVRKTMDALPKGIFAYYGKAMERIEKQEEEERQQARKALSYLFCARRPLKLNELLHALSVELEDTGLDETGFPETEILLSISAGLIRVDEKSGIVGLVHYTLQEYLGKHPEKLLPDPDVEIGRACLTYLSFDVFQGGPCSSEEGLHRRLQEYQFLDYASHHWGFHLVEYQFHEMVEGLLLAFLNDEQKLSSSVQILRLITRQTRDWYERFPKQFGPLHVVAYWGLDKILMVLFEKDIDVDGQDSYGATALQLAAKYGHQSVVQLLLSKGADSNLTNENGETALYWAARNGHKAIAQLLLSHGANVLTKDYEGWTALDWAVLGGNNDVLKLLLKHGADITAGNDGEHKALYLAAEEGHELTLQMLLDSGVDVNARDSLGSTALDFTAPSGHEKAMQVLLRNGADVKSRDTYGNTILHWAVSHKTLVRLLLDYGVDVNAKNNKGQAPLSWIAQDGPVAIAELLLENNADVNTKDNYGLTPVHLAALRGREAMVRLLLDNGANPNVKDRDGWTPLHAAALKRHESVVKILLDRVDDGRAILDWGALQDTKKQALLEETAETKADAATALTGLRETIQERQLGRSQVLLDKGADVNGKDVGGCTALIIAVSHGYEDCVQLLLENGADVNLRSRDGRTALHWASEYGHDGVVKLLVENGADVNASVYSWTAMLLAGKNEYMAIMHFLIENGADVDAADYHSRTGLHWAAKHGSRPILRMLVDKGAKLNAVDRWGRTALIWAVENMQKRAVKMLVKIGADVDAKARNGYTALHIAAFMGFESAVHCLLEGGADFEAKARHSLTALHIAAFIGWESIVEQLLHRGANFDAEAQWCGDEDSEEYENGVVEFDLAEKSLNSHLQRCFLEQGTAADVGIETRHGLTAQQLAASEAGTHLPRWFLEQSTFADVGVEVQHGLTA